PPPGARSDDAEARDGRRAAGRLRVERAAPHRVGDRRARARGRAHRGVRFAVHVRRGRGDFRDLARRARRHARQPGRRGGAPRREDGPRAGFSSIVEGWRYATRRPELIGTYLVDIVAMTFAMPTAVFPALAEQWGGEAAVGFLYSSMSVGAFLVTVFSKWTA